MTKFEHLLIEQIPSLRRYAYALTSHINNTDDLVQDTLERAIKKQSLWIRRGKIRPWLFTIMHNLYINQVKIKRINTVDGDEELGNIASQATDPELDIYVNQLRDRLQQLPLPQKEVLLLVSLEGFSYEEVTKILDVPMGTVMSRLYRAREKLNEQIQQDNLVPLRRVK